MREVFNHRDFTRVGFYKSVLDEAGIPNFIRNECAQFITELPSALFFPALCVTNDADYDQAMRLLQEIDDPTPAIGTDWRCPNCAEENPGTFEICWNCSANATPDHGDC